MPKKITVEDYAAIKSSLKWYKRLLQPDVKVAKKHKVSLKTVLQVDGSRTYLDYKRNVKAQHPEVQFSLRDHVLALHDKTYREAGKAYIEPASARQAILELLNE